MRLILEIDMDNAAFEAEGETSRFRSGNEVARILRQLALDINETHVEVGEEYQLRDLNGNTVGGAKIISGSNVNQKKSAAAHKGWSKRKESK